jgi:uncharacterized protein (DUF58 family)
VAESVVAAAGARRVRITSNGWAAVAGAGLMFAMAIQTQSIWMQVVGSALLGLLGVSALSVIRRRDGVTVSVQAPHEVVVGIPFDIQVVVSNARRRPTAPLRIRCYFASAVVVPVVVYVDPVPAGDETTVSTTRVPLQRGASRRTRQLVDTIGPFGFFTSTRQVDAADGLFAAPLAGPTIDLPRVLGVQADGFGPLGPGLDVRGVREWRPGDAVRHVHWRSTARTGRIAVLEHGEPTVGAIGVLVAGTTADARFEASLAVAVSTAWRAIGDGIQLVVPFWNARGPRLVTSSYSIRRLSQWHRIFSLLRAEIPQRDTVDAVIAEVGSGGIVLMAVGNGVPVEFLSYVESAAMIAGVRVINCADYIDGRR